MEIWDNTEPSNLDI